MSNTIVGMCCLHVGATSHDKNTFQSYIHYIRRTHVDVVILGDLCDFGVPNSKHPETVWQQTITPGEQIDKCADILYPIRKNIKAICGGNHADRIYRLTGVHPEKVIADLLGVKYVPNGHTFNYHGKTFYMTHGKGSSDFNKVLLRHSGIDIFLIGHTHNWEHKVVCILHGKNQIKRQIHLIRCGSFLNDAEYAKKAIYQPTPVGSPFITIDKNKVQVNFGI